MINGEILGFITGNPDIGLSKHHRIEKSNDGIYYTYGLHRFIGVINGDDLVVKRWQPER